jgi:hypothetical protein
MNPYIVPKFSDAKSYTHAIHLACSHPNWFSSNIVTIAQKRPVTSALCKIQIANENSQILQVFASEH